MTRERVVGPGLVVREREDGRASVCEREREREDGRASVCV